MFLEILCDGVEPLAIFSRQRRRAAKTKFSSQRSRKEFHLRGPQRQPMIRARTRHTRRRLDHVQPVHLATFAIDFRVLIELAAAGELFYVANMATAHGTGIGM